MRKGKVGLWVVLGSVIMGGLIGGEFSGLSHNQRLPVERKR